MADVWYSFRECGGTSFIILFFTVVALTSALAAALAVFGSKNRQLGIMLSAITVCLAVGIFGVGEYGQISGRARTEEALQNMSASTAIDATMRDEIRTEGYKESAQCVSIGIGGSALPLIFGVVLLTSALLKKKNEDDVK